MFATAEQLRATRHRGSFGPGAGLHRRCRNRPHKGAPAAIQRRRCAPCCRSNGTSKRVYSSGAALTNSSIARFVAAPARFSMTNCWPRRFDSDSPIRRASRRDPCRSDNDDTHRPRQITLRCGGLEYNWQCRRARCYMQEFAPGKCHPCPLSPHEHSSSTNIAGCEPRSVDV